MYMYSAHLLLMGYYENKVVNSSANINRTNDNLLSKIIEHKKHHKIHKN